MNISTYTCISKMVRGFPEPCWFGAMYVTGRTYLGPRRFLQKTLKPKTYKIAKLNMTTDLCCGVHLLDSRSQHTHHIFQCSAGRETDKT